MSDYPGILSTDENRIDPNIDRKKAIFDREVQTAPGESDRPLFAKLELSVTGLCSRRCVFCPRVDPNVYPNKREHYPVDEHQKLMCELAEAGWRGTVSYSGFGEPMMHPDIERLIGDARRILPSARLEMVTNGDFLKHDRALEILDAGIDVMIVSLYDGPEQLERFSSLREAAGIPEEKMLLRIRYKPPEEHYGLTVSNRAGNVDLSHLGIGDHQFPISHPCFYPHYSIFVEFDGTVLLCCNDWTKEQPLGNVFEKGLLEVWHGSLLDRIRSRLLEGDRGYGNPCASCSVLGTRMGGKHAAAFSELFDRAGSK